MSGTVDGPLARTDRMESIGQPCPACGEQSLAVFFHEDNVPTNSCLLLDDPGAALSFGRGELRIGFCDSCGFVTNTAFQAEAPEYSQRYEETQGFSPKFMEFAKSLADRWVEQYDLKDKTVLEIGCGKGEFLVLMAEAGAGHCIGIDPGVHPERIESAKADDIEWIVDFYDESYSNLDADAIICRHTLEHIPDVAAFMTSIRQAIGDRPDTVVLFELPDVRRVLEEAAFWDVYYEHCSYFSAGSLGRLFRATGFEVIDISLEYDDQYLLIEARPSSVPAVGDALPIEDDLGHLRDAVGTFITSYTETASSWQSRLRAVAADGGTSVIWGSGSKGVSFVSNLGVSSEIAAAVDINPFKHGQYMVGSGHPIISPEELRALDPSLVVVMNPIYVPEISAQLAALGIECEVAAL